MVRVGLLTMVLGDRDRRGGRLVGVPPGRHPGQSNAGGTQDRRRRPPDWLDGTWTVRPGEEVFAGYRITEDFGVIHNTAVARTGAVEGRFTVEGTKVTGITATVNMASLTSQDDQLPVAAGNRDAAMKTQGLETDTFPTATFTATEAHRAEEAPGARREDRLQGRREAGPARGHPHGDRPDDRPLER